MAPPKRPWFRLYVETVWDRKIRKLSPEHRWLWVTILACARSSPLPGLLLLSEHAPMDSADLADAAALREQVVAKGLFELERLGLVERDSNLDAWSVPKWNERQFESDETTKRTAKHRAKERSNNGEVAPPEDRGQKQKSEVRTPLTPASGGRRANGTSPRQLAAKDRYKAALEDKDLCQECSAAFTCQRHGRRIADAETELRAVGLTPANVEATA